MRLAAEGALSPPPLPFAAAARGRADGAGDSTWVVLTKYPRAWSKTPSHMSAAHMPMDFSNMTQCRVIACEESGAQTARGSQLFLVIKAVTCVVDTKSGGGREGGGERGRCLLLRNRDKQTAGGQKGGTKQWFFESRLLRLAAHLGMNRRVCAVQGPSCQFQELGPVVAELKQLGVGLQYKGKGREGKVVTGREGGDRNAQSQNGAVPAKVDQNDCQLPSAE